MLFRYTDGFGGTADGAFFGSTAAGAALGDVLAVEDFAGAETVGRDVAFAGEDFARVAVGKDDLAVGIENDDNHRQGIEQYGEVWQSLQVCDLRGNSLGGITLGEVGDVIHEHGGSPVNDEQQRRDKQCKLAVQAPVLNSALFYAKLREKQTLVRGEGTKRKLLSYATLTPIPDLKSAR